MKSLRAAIICFTLCVFTAWRGNAQNVWPKSITADDGTLIKIYEPEPESFDGNMLKSKSVISILDKDSTNPIFGTFWSISTVQADKVNKVVNIISVNVPNLRFATDIAPEKISYLKDVLESRIPAVTGNLSLDAINNALANGSRQKQLSKTINNAAPQIYYADHPSMLVTIDGEPRLQYNNDWGVDVVVNSPFTIVKNSDGNFYLYGQKHWYIAQSASGPYRDAGYNIPEKLQKIGGDIASSVENDPGYSSDTDLPKNDKVPDVIVTTKPAELLQTDGLPDFTALNGTQLQFITNTDNDIFKYLPDQQYYVLLSGRWYRSPSLEQGPWSYVESNSLPPDFSKIPEGSSKDDVLSSVAGTEAARDAILDAQVPQTARVDRRNAQADVTYDGQPEFEDIDGTDMQYAVNTQSPVIRFRDMYYCVDRGVWFESFSPGGPWTVSIVRPAQVDIIPPTCPVYNVKYVYIFDAGPDWVYTGYTPGYLNTYVYGGTVVYGTGYYYRPWFGTFYYPRPYTWGFGVVYNPWAGFSLGWHFGYGWLNTGIAVNRWRGWHGGWWGPAVYHPPYRWGGYRRTGFYGSGFAGNRTVVVHNNINIYNYRRNVVTVNRINTRQRLIDNRVGNGENRLNSARRVNVYRDRQGNVYDRNRQGQWQPRDRRIQGGGNNNQNPSQNNVRNNNRVNRANRNNNVQPRPNNQQQPAQRPAQNTQRRRPDNNNRPNNNNSNNDNNNRPRRHHD